MRMVRERVLLILAGLCVLQFLYYAPRMPEQMASHFDNVGLPDGWSGKTAFFLLYAGMLFFVFLSFRVLPGLLSRFPDSVVNLPNKAYWLASERRAETFLRIRQHLGHMGTGVLIFILAVFQLVLMANLTEGRRLNTQLLWVLLLLFLLFALFWTVMFIRSFRMPTEKRG